jgi:hypothetical protein
MYLGEELVHPLSGEEHRVECDAEPEGQQPLRVRLLFHK